MSTHKKLVISLFILAALCISLFFVTISIYSGDKEKMPVNEPPAPKTQNIPAPLPEAAQASVPGSDTETYILKYKAENDTVYLITKKTDGTEIMSPVESINPFYLTEEDMKALTDGIELTEREDMFILIEDFSS